MMRFARGGCWPQLRAAIFAACAAHSARGTAAVPAGVPPAELLAELTRSLIALLGRSRLLLLVALTLVIMFPGMITGSCTASVLGTGVIVAPVLMRMGLARATTGAVVSNWPVCVSPGCRCQVRCQAWYGASGSSDGPCRRHHLWW